MVHLGRHTHTSTHADFTDKMNFTKISGTYGTAQFKLDRTRVQQGHDTTHFLFHTCASLRVHARLVT